jgi:hypothetical protein
LFTGVCANEVRERNIVKRELTIKMIEGLILILLNF